MVLEKKKISHGCHDMVVQAKMLNASSLVNSISPRVFFFFLEIHSFIFSRVEKETGVAARRNQQRPSLYPPTGSR